MDTTPIYTELQRKLIDPEADNWGPSAPPEFAATLAEHAEHGQRSKADSTRSRTGSTGHGGRRHRAED